MRIYEFIWNSDRIEHIARHNVTPNEVEEVCFGSCLVLKAKSEGNNPVYYVLGQTNAGKYLFCVVIQFPDRKGYPITARPMTDNERKRYQKWRKS
ncbi:BrnT family toxin [Cyanothece sp. BG0011]|uniref:BrnT family toxin n=1 Tax=Cyanothece sp. BG0011 TaxID=2082950 RepID=UPI000D1E327C|nr:BrnT family toxin [Cyanothece sp. BG0011]